MNGCIAIERALNVVKGIQFNQRKSKRIARWIIIILPIFIMSTIIHEPLHRDLFEYHHLKYKSDSYDSNRNETMVYENGTNETIPYEIEKYVLCVITYSARMQNYNTVILFFHLIGPFIANLCSALCIIFKSARRRSATRSTQTIGQHALEQLSEHKQLIISPILLLVLSSPRLIMSLISGCINVSDNFWLYLCGYFISFTPSTLIFIIFVVPSKLYMDAFKQSWRNWQSRS